MSVAYLRVGAEGGETLAFEEELIVGRASLSGVALRDTRMSRRHARFMVDAQGCVRVEDMGSTNGTFVNGARVVGTITIKPGDVVRLSETTFELIAASYDDGAAGVPQGVSEPERAAHERTRLWARMTERWRGVRIARAELPAFPNAPQIPSFLPIPAWWSLRALSILLTLAVAIANAVSPSAGLRVTWGIGIPLLPILFFLAPGLWRNVCPLAAANQLPRVLGFTRGYQAPRWLGQYGYLVSILLFAGFVSLRKVGLQTNGPLTGLLLVGAIGSGFVGGLVLKGKSGWCSSICPLLPVQRVYGQTPFALVGNSHCQPCIGCTKNCYDFNPRAAYLADLNDDDRAFAAGRKFFIAAFPGLILGFFEVPNRPMRSVPAIYAELALYVAVGMAVFYLLDAFVRVSAHKLTTLYAMAALNIFYWFAFPTIVKAATGSPSPATLTWAARAVLGALSVAWVARTFTKERAFLARAAAAPATPLGASRALQLHSRAMRTKPEVTFLPDGRCVVVQAGMTVLEVAEANGLSIEAGCRMGVCGADPIAVVEGIENVTPIGDDERSTLERLGLASNTRMACCCRIRGHISISLTPEQAAAPTPSQVHRREFDRAIEHVVIIGNGIAGITAADYARRTHPDCAIDVIAEEPHHLYNRMAITRLVYGRSAMQGLYLNPDSWCEQHGITLWLNTRARAIDRETGRVSLATGESLGYDRLVLAMGGSSVVPPIDGWGAPGAFVLRSAADAIEMRAFAQVTNARRAVIAGGGLLGLEAAYALHKLGLETVVLERSERLLRRQLDQRAGELLTRYMDGLGIGVWTNAETAAVAQNGRLREVVMKDGRNAIADVLVVAAGVRPNLELARDAGLATGRGVTVDDHMRTSDEHVFAAGDVAEFEGQVYGLWPPAVEQGRIAGEMAAGATPDAYRGSVPVTVLKVVGVDLTSMGRIEPQEGDEAIAYEDEAELRYGKLVVAGGRIVGAVLLGYSTEVALVASALKQGWDVAPILDELRRGRFDALGQLGGDRPLSPVSVVGVGSG